MLEVTHYKSVENKDYWKDIKDIEIATYDYKPVLVKDFFTLSPHEQEATYPELYHELTQMRIQYAENIKAKIQRQKDGDL